MPPMIAVCGVCLTGLTDLLLLILPPKHFWMKLRIWDFFKIIQPGEESWGDVNETRLATCSF